LGGRVLRVWQVPGHTPDAVALEDRALGLLFTGDSYYDGPIWLYVPETDLDAYDSSMVKLSLLPGLRRLHPAHNTVSAEPASLARTVSVLRRIRAGEVAGVPEANGRLTFQANDITILTAKPVLDGRRADQGRGGSGLTVWE